LVELKFEPAKYGKAVSLLQELLFFPAYSAERVRVSAKKLIKAVSKRKRQGEDVWSVSPPYRR
jgi:hypothetical protein